MTYLLLFGLLASVIAAPQYFDFNSARLGPPPFFPDNRNMRIREDYPGQSIFDENIFDMNKFWRVMSQELREIDDMLADMKRHLPITSPISQHEVEGNEYKIKIPLVGFDEEDIVVKAREGLLMIQACHKYPGGLQKNYIDVRNLPKTLVMNGTWIYENAILKITFPLKEGVTTVEPAYGLATDFTTKRPIFDREEIDEDHDSGINEDVDVGLDRSDLGKDTEILTNIISDRETVEATTYAVDLKDEIEFVPVRY